MLDEKLKRASEETARQTKRLIIAVAAVLFCGALLVMFLSMDFGSVQTVAEKNVSQPETVASTETIENKNELRGLAKEKIRTYEEELKPALEASNLNGWNQLKENEIQSLENAALKSFSYGEYREAIANLGKLEKSAKAILKERDAIFSSNMEAAATALSTDNYIEAELHISKALVVLPGSEVGIELKRKIDALPEILKLLKDADVAQIENNIEKAYALVNKAFKLDPNRTELRQRAEHLSAEIKERQFQFFVVRSQRGIEKKDVALARGAFQKAKGIFPQRPELDLLIRDIAALERAEDLRLALSKAELIAAKDNWRDAKEIYQDALKRHPNDKKLQNGLQLSTAIMDLHDKMNEHLAKPERLASPNISRIARDLLVGAGVLARNSPSLADAAMELNRVLEQMNTKVPVTVISDNQTNVRVKGVGKVGAVSKKTIHLRPGEYFFEGVRQGYRSKIVQVTIVAGAGSSTVEIKCDEPI